MKIGNIKLGPGEGNSGAVIRFGRHWDKGLWFRLWRFRKLWFRWRFRPGLIDLGFVVIQW